MALHVHDIGIIVGEQRRDVANQARTVERVEAEVDGVGPCSVRLAPADLDNAFRVPLVQAEEVAAVLTVNADASSLGDVTDDGLGWYRPAAAREIRHEIADTRDRCGSQACPPISFGFCVGECFSDISCRGYAAMPSQ